MTRLSTSLIGGVALAALIATGAQAQIVKGPDMKSVERGR